MAFYVNGQYFNEKKPDTILGGCIAIYENVWDNASEDIRLLEYEVESKNSPLFWEKAPTLGLGSQQDLRTNSSMRLSYFCSIYGNEVSQHISNKFNRILLQHSYSYLKTFNCSEQEIRLFHESYQVLKYQTGTEYKAHYDGGSATKRVVSAICYLNSDYDGGELEFVNFKLKIKPQSGMLILFPSNFAYTHIAHPIKSGTKYALVTWLSDEPSQYTNNNIF